MIGPITKKCVRKRSNSSKQRNLSSKKLRQSSKVCPSQSAEEPIGKPADLERGSLKDRSLGVLFGGMCGDALGAAVEGFSLEDIEAEYPNGLRSFVSAQHMGLYHLPPRLGYYTG